MKTMLMEQAGEGTLLKQALAELLTPDARHTFLDVCAGIERELRTRCAARSGGCLVSGCPLDGEACLDALLTAAPEYNEACTVVWRALFDDPTNRVAGWVH
jgi:hypothetical protein